MKKSKFILAILIFLLALATVGCSSGVNVNDVSKKSSGASKSSSSVSVEKSYSITIETVENGSVTVDGGITEAVKGESVTFTVSANDNYELAWIKVNGGNDLKSAVKNGKLTITMPERDVVVSAYFCLKGEQDSSSYPPVQESSSKGDTYSAVRLNCENGTFQLSKYNDIKAGETVYVYATPEVNYVVKNVKVSTKENNSQNIPVVKNAENWSFTMPACSVNVSVEFEIQKYSINVKSTEGVSVTLDRYVASEGETVKITGVNLNVGYRLVEIKVNGQTITGNEFVMPASSATVEAVVEKIEYTVDVISNENAEITLAGGLKYNYADEVSVTVSVNQGYKLKNIIVTTQEENAQTIAVSLNGNSGTFTMPACSVSISVELEKQVYTVTAKKVTGVSYTVDKTTATMGETVTISNVITDTGVILKEFRVNGQKIENNSFVMPAENVTIEPIIEKTVYTVTIASCENGSVSLKDGLNYNYGDKVVLVLSPATDYQLDTVSVKTASGKTVEVSNLTFTMPAENVTVTVTFKTAEQKYTVTVNTCENGRVYVTNAKSEYVYGETVTLSVSADDNYVLESITVKCGEQTIELNGYAFAIPQGNVTVEAKFVKKSFAVTVDSENGKTNLASSYKWGETVTFDVTPDDEYDVSGVTLIIDGASTVLSKGASGYQFTMPASDVTIKVEYTVRKYTITVAENANGTITVNNSGSKFAKGEVITLTVTANIGYRLKSLTYNGTLITSSSFTMPAEDVTIEAEFEKLTYNVNITYTGKGSVTCASSVVGYNDDVVLNITAETGYSLTKLVVAGTDVTNLVSDGTYAFKMPASDVKVEATFSADSYNITTVQSVGGTISAPKNATYKQVVSLSLTKVETGYKFVKIIVKQGDTIIEITKVRENEYEFTMPDGDVTVSVEFEHISYTITVVSQEGGSAQASKSTAYYGDEISLTVTPNAGYRQKSITGVTLVDGKFTMPNENVTITVTFEKIAYTITVNAGDGGSAQASKTTAYYGDEITLTVTPNTGYKQKSITGVTLVDGKFTMPNENVTITVTFEKVAYAITVNAGDGGSAQASKTTAYYGDEITLTITPNTGYKQKSITGVTLTSGKFTMPNENVTITVTFEKIAYSLSVSSSTGGNATLSKATANYGDTITVNATPDTGYEVGSITVNGSVISGTTFSMPAKNTSVVVNFVKKQYTITVSATNGSVTPSKTTAYYGDEITLTVTPNSGYILDSLTMNGTAVSNNKFTMPASNVTVSATFKVGTLKVTAGTCSNGKVTPSATSVNYNTVVTFTATPDKGYELDYFLVDGTKISGNTYTVTKDITVTAVFKAKTFTLTIIYRCAGTSETLDTETQQMTFGTSKTITPTKSFTGYTKTTTTLNVTMNEEGKTVYVEYTINTYTLTVKHLIYNDGGAFANTETYTLKYKESKTISPVSLTAYNGVIKADATSKQVTMGAGDKTETFTYSLDTTKKLSSGMSTGALKVITANTGFSVTYKQTDNTSYAINDWCLLFAIDKCNIGAGCMQWFDDSGNLVDDWFDGMHGHGNNDIYGPTYNWNAVIKEGCVYTVSVNTDGTIVWYRDGLKVLYFSADVKHNSKTISEFVTQLISKVRSVGISLGDGSVVMNGTTYKTTLSDFVIGYQVTEKSVTVNYNSTDGSIKRGSSVYKLAPGYAYTFNTALSGYTASAESVTTSTGTTDETFNITYTRKASTEKTFVSDYILVARKGKYGTDGFVNINNITGDFYMEVSIGDLYQMQSGNDTWRSMLTAIFSSGTNVGRYYRFDRHSWFVNSPYGEWTQGNSWYSSDSIASQVMKGRSDLTITISRKSGTIVVVYKIYSYATGATYYMDFTCESMSGAIDVKFGGEDCSYTLKSIKVENNSTGELSVDTSKIGTTVYNSNGAYSWEDVRVRTSYEGLDGNFVTELDIYQSAVDNTTDKSYTNAKWRTPLLALYAYGDYSNHTILRQDGHFWMGAGQTVGSSVSVTTNDSTIFLGNVNSTSTKFYDIVKNAYVKIVVVGENVGTTSGKVYVTYYIYSLNSSYSDTVYRVSYEISGVQSKLDVVLICESSSYTVQSALAKKAEKSYSHTTAGWTSQIDYQPETVLTGAFEQNISYTTVLNGDRANGNWTTPILILYDSASIDNRLVFRLDWWAWKDGTDISDGTFGANCDSRGHSFTAKLGTGESGAELYDVWKACFVKVKITRDASNKVRIEMNIYGVGGTVNVWYEFSTSNDLKVAYAMECSSFNLINGL